MSLKLFLVFALLFSQPLFAVGGCRLVSTGGQQQALLTPFLDLDVPPRVESNDFGRRRNLATYYTFLNSLKEALNKLNEGSHWIDLGTGDGIAPLDYKEGGGPAKVTGIGYGHPVHGDREGLTFLSGQLFEEIPMEKLGPPADLMTDLFGVFSYTKNMTEYLMRSLSHLKSGAPLMIYGSFETNWIETNTGRLTIVEFLEGLPGLSVHRENWPSGELKALVIRRTPVFSPEFIPHLELMEYSDFNPPARRWRVIY